MALLCDGALRGRRLPGDGVRHRRGSGRALPRAGAGPRGDATFLLQRTLPERQQVEGFSLYYAAFALGMGVGSGLAGVLLSQGLPRGVLLLSAAVPLLAAALSLLARRYNAPQSG
ncbi:hypothetical protein FGE12_13090 [Aggregicoccus sp. 17bor-14]|uniref:hypothetical protein n=1 Tax=Myxococcaceae TaxID=31 RepID=UPI00129CD828|nr:MULTISPECIES: hypothetical protein [Myxococcaceae]MBF5043326.1 hypothetical protein [Simulacricoccus sp. 17bor-14]MRI89085.1 hypothetical protein [Aggregicoccus sp. 17bor-14]